AALTDSPVGRARRVGRGGVGSGLVCRAGRYGLGMDHVEVRRSRRARRWRLEVPWGEPVRPTAPWSMSQVEVEQVLREKRAWIEKQRRREVPRLGLEGLAVSESEARIGAKEIVSALAEEEAELLGVSYRRIRIGAQRTLWGSCS